MRDGGWIPPQQRDAEQRLLSQNYAERIGNFALVGHYIRETPTRVIFGELEIKHLGKLLPRIWQVTGSCVGCGGAQAYMRAMLGDIIHRGDNETCKMPFPFATYGKGREIAGMNRTGDGSFGAAQAEAVDPQNFGMLEWDDERVPSPTLRNGWAKWTKQQELQWSHPSAWPVPIRELFPTATKYGIHTITQVKTTEQWKQLLAQGYGVTLASMFGTRRAQIQGDVAIASRNSSWAHQMSSSGYWVHPQHGLIFLIDNQWGPAESIHNVCPTLSKIGINGSFWIKESDARWILNSGEVFGHSATGGFPSREFRWNLARYE